MMTSRPRLPRELYESARSAAAAAGLDTTSLSPKDVMFLASSAIERDLAVRAVEDIESGSEGFCISMVHQGKSGWQAFARYPIGVSGRDDPMALGADPDRAILSLLAVVRDLRVKGAPC